MLSVSETSCHCEHSLECAATNRVEHSKTFDCFGNAKAMTRGSVQKISIVMLSEAKHLLDSIAPT